MKKETLRTIDGETLMNRPFTSIPFVIHSLLPVGLHILARAPKIGLIVIDTLQKIRRMSYANDYRDIGVLKELADKQGVAILLVHHLLKQHDDDPMNMVSGTTGITGAVDSSFALTKTNAHQTGRCSSAPAGILNTMNLCWSLTVPVMLGI